ncbi:hypothetical protein LXL04_034846 [Taraxacum kok-saghyz]
MTLPDLSLHGWVWQNAGPNVWDARWRRIGKHLMILLMGQSYVEYTSTVLRLAPGKWQMKVVGSPSLVGGSGMVDRSLLRRPSHRSRLTPPPPPRSMVAWEVPHQEHRNQHRWQQRSCPPLDLPEVLLRGLPPDLPQDPLPGLPLVLLLAQAGSRESGPSSGCSHCAAALAASSSRVAAGIISVAQEEIHVVDSICPVCDRNSKKYLYTVKLRYSANTHWPNLRAQSVNLSENLKGYQDCCLGIYAKDAWEMYFHGVGFQAYSRTKIQLNNIKRMMDDNDNNDDDQLPYFNYDLEIFFKRLANVFVEIKPLLALTRFLKLGYFDTGSKPRKPTRNISTSILSSKSTKWANSAPIAIFRENFPTCGQIFWKRLWINGKNNQPRPHYFRGRPEFEPFLWSRSNPRGFQGKISPHAGLTQEITDSFAIESNPHPHGLLKPGASRCPEDSNTGPPIGKPALLPTEPTITC